VPGPAWLTVGDPTNGLDADGIIWVRQVLRGYAAEGRRVFVSSHVLSEVTLTADHLILVGRGRLIADTSTEQLLASASGGHLLVRSDRDAELAALLQSHGATVTKAADTGGGLSVRGLDAQSIGRLAAERAIPVHELSPHQASLEDAYRQLTGQARDHRADEDHPRSQGAAS
jgi:ABC-2 type transport system ATP-binding protein